MEINRDWQAKKPDKKKGERRIIRRRPQQFVYSEIVCELKRCPYDGVCVKRGGVTQIVCKFFKREYVVKYWCANCRNEVSEDMRECSCGQKLGRNMLRGDYR